MKRRKDKLRSILTPPGATEPVWMPIPAVFEGIPPGLEYLELIDNLLIKQGSAEDQAACNYVIMNGVGQKVYYAFEEPELCAPQGGDRGFTLHMLDNFNKEVMRLEHPLIFSAGFASFDMPHAVCSAELIVEAAPGNVIGRVKQRKSGCLSTYAILDEQGKTALLVSEAASHNEQLDADADEKLFEVHTPDGAKIGEMRKRTEEAKDDNNRNGDYFGISFPRDLSIKTKATLLGATFLIDYVIHERWRGRRDSRPTLPRSSTLGKNMFATELEPATRYRARSAPAPSFRITANHERRWDAMKVSYWFPIWASRWAMLAVGFHSNNVVIGARLLRLLRITKRILENGLIRSA